MVNIMLEFSLMEYEVLLTLLRIYHLHVEQLIKIEW